MAETNIQMTNVVEELTDTVASTPSFWQSYGSILIWAVVIGSIFAYLWRKGHLARFVNYVQLTREELRKCSWPTWDELKGSTVVISISILLLGGFTVVVDFICKQVLLLLT